MARWREHAGRADRLTGAHHDPDSTAPVKDLLEADRGRVTGQQPSPRPGLTRRAVLLVLIVVLALFASALGYLVNDQLQEHRQFDRAQAALTVTHHRTSAVSRQLAELNHELNLLLTKVGDDSTTLNQDTAQLKAAQIALAGTQADVSQQSSLITALHTCLGGVEQALNALAVGQQSSALAELSSVSSSCSAAAAASG